MIVVSGVAVGLEQSTLREVSWGSIEMRLQMKWEDAERQYVGSESCGSLGVAAAVEVVAAVFVVFEVVGRSVETFVIRFGVVAEAELD